MIGVNDDGDAIGLDRDYGSLNGNKDEFEIHLRNVLNEALGKSFIASNVKVVFSDINEVEVCKIEIQKSKKPLYLNTIDDRGQKQEKFYVRSGNTSQELLTSEISGYVANNYK